PDTPTKISSGTGSEVSLGKVGAYQAGIAQINAIHFCVPQVSSRQVYWWNILPIRSGRCAVSLKNPLGGEPDLALLGASFVTVMVVLRLIVPRRLTSRHVRHSKISANHVQDCFALTAGVLPKPLERVEPAESHGGRAGPQLFHGLGVQLRDTAFGRIMVSSPGSLLVGPLTATGEYQGDNATGRDTDRQACLDQLDPCRGIAANVNCEEEDG
ncbi:hypothetical protein, partial [Actinophytocola xanthii]